MEIKIDPTERYHKEVFQLLKELKYERDIASSNKFPYHTGLFQVEEITKQSILRSLKKRGVVKWTKEYGKDKLLWVFELELNEPEFSRTYSLYKNTFDKTEWIVIYDNGWVELFLDGSEHKEKFSTGGKSYNLLLFLAENQGSLRSFKEIEDHLGYSERQARDAVGYLVDKLGYMGNQFVQTDGGYKLLCSVIKRKA